MKIKIGLIDVDGYKDIRGQRKQRVYPNLALMKISAYHKSLGDSVEWCFPLEHYDIVYQSKVFTFSSDIEFVPNAEKIVKGGTGYSLHGNLPDEIEHIMPDYSIYGITDTAYGFLTRGCPRHCDFCIVGDKEGLVSRKVADLREWWDGQEFIELLDPNILACRERLDLLTQLSESRALVNFSQGLDIRLMTEDVIEILNNTRVKCIHFAWDNPREDLTGKFQFFTERYKRKTAWMKSVYVLTNFNSTMEENLYRIYTLRDLGYDPYCMVYEKWNAPKEIRDLQRWCNNKRIFKSCPNFSDYGRGENIG